jgi:hypothetical protein
MLACGALAGAVRASALCYATAPAGVELGVLIIVFHLPFPQRQRGQVRPYVLHRYIPGGKKKIRSHTRGAEGLMRE